MSACPCGCGNEVKPGLKYARRGCSLRGSVISAEERVARSKEVLATIPLWQKQEWGSKGGRASLIERWSDLLEKWQNMSPREALYTAYWRGYHSGYTAGQLNRRKRRAA